MYRAISISLNKPILSTYMPGFLRHKKITGNELVFVAWRAGTTNRVVVPAHQAWNRFLVSTKGLQIRALK